MIDKNALKLDSFETEFHHLHRNMNRKFVNDITEQEAEKYLDYVEKNLTTVYPSYPVIDFQKLLVIDLLYEKNPSLSAKIQHIKQINHFIYQAKEGFLNTILV